METATRDIAMDKWHKGREWIDNDRAFQSKLKTIKFFALCTIGFSFGAALTIWGFYQILMSID